MESLLETDLAWQLGVDSTSQLTAITLPSETGTSVEQFLEKLKSYKTSKKPASLPVDIFNQDFGWVFGYYRNTYLSSSRETLTVRKLMDEIPEFEGQPLSDLKFTLSLARKFRLIPRTFPDNVLYRSISPEYVAGRELGTRSAVYNCSRLQGPDFPRHTYWHELFAVNSFYTDAHGVFITVNRPFKVTNTPVSQIRQLAADWVHGRLEQLLGTN